MHFSLPKFAKLIRMPLLTGAIAAFLWQIAAAQEIDNFTKLGNFGRFVAQTPVQTPAPDLNYLLFTPENTEAQIDGKFPLIVSLSGIGERGNDLDILKNDGLPAKLDGWNSFPFMVIAPQCPLTTEWYWDRTDTLIRRMIENVIAEHPVDPDRVYLTGYSMGGIGSWDMAARHPDLFAGVIPIAARREPGTSFCNMRDIPAWVFHGANDPVVPLTAGRGAVNVFRACGGNARFTVYPGVGHNSWTQTYANTDIYEWLLKQNRRKVNAVFAAGNLVFFGMGNALIVQQFDDAAQLPHTIAELPLPEAFTDLQSVAGSDVLAAIGETALLLIDIANPQQPAVISATSLGGAKQIALRGQTAFLAGENGLTIFDISDPAQPQQLAAVDTLGTCFDVFADSQLVWLAAGAKSHIIDTSDPAAPQYVGAISGFGSSIRAITVENGLAFLADEFTGLQIIDVQNPANPVGVSAALSGHKISEIQIRGNLGFVAAGDSGLKIIELSDPAHPAEIAGWQSPGRSIGLSFGEIFANGQPAAHVFVADFSAGVRAVNIADPANPAETAFIQVAPSSGGSVSFGKAYRSQVENGVAYVAYGWEGLKIVDVSQPQQPSLIGKKDSPGDARDVRVFGDIAYLADWDAGVRVLDISNPQQPQEIRFVNTGRARQLAVKNEFIYVAASDSGMVLLDISNPQQPEKAAVFPAYFARSVAIDGNIAALADDHRVVFFDISDPANPLETGATAALVSGCDGLALSGTTAFFPDGDTLRIFDISNPAAPQQISTAALGAIAFDATVTQHFVFIAAGNAGLQAFDVSNPHSPIVAGVYNGAPFARGVAVAENRVFVAEEADGLSIYRFDALTALPDIAPVLPQAVSLAQNYPNPFNPQTAISYQLPNFNAVKLSIYNMLGQEIKTLVDQKQAAGSYTVSWDGTNAFGAAVASGVYIYRLSAGDAVSVKKMLLLR